MMVVVLVVLLVNWQLINKLMAAIERITCSCDSRAVKGGAALINNVGGGRWLHN